MGIQLDQPGSQGVFRFTNLIRTRLSKSMFKLFPYDAYDNNVKDCDDTKSICKFFKKIV